MKKGIFAIVLLMSFALMAMSAFSFDFTGYVYDVNKTPLSGVNVSCNVYYGPNIDTIITQPSTTSASNGSFHLPLNDSWAEQGLPWESYSIKPVIIHNNSAGLADLIGASAPDFPGGEFASLGAVDFYLKEAVTLDITANNGTIGVPVNFSYMIKDKKLGYPLYNHFTNGDPDINHTRLIVPKDRSYSIMIFPYHSFPISYDISNISDYGNALTINITFDTSNLWRSVQGYINATAGITNFGTGSNITIIPYLMEPGNMIGKDHPLPLNMSNMRNDAQPGTVVDIINLTTGFYNLSMPGPSMGMDVILFVNVQNGSGDYFGALRNLTLSNSNEAINLNISALPLVGIESNFSVQSAANGPWGEKMVWTRQGNFSINNGSSSTDAYPNNAHVEVKVDYTSIGQGNFTWMIDVMQSNSGNFKIPIFNASITRINVYAPQFAPQKMGKTALQLAPAIINVTLKNFNPGAIQGQPEFSDLYMDMFVSNSTCDAYNATGRVCSVFAGAAEKGKSNFNPLTAIMGGGKISFRMRKASNNITIHYVNVDMLASGPPDAMFDSSSTDRGSGSSLDQAWRFGSNGPEIYDKVIMGIPYNESDVSEAHTQRVVIKNLYDENWNLIWNATEYPAGLDTSNASFSSYGDFNQLWFNTTGGGMVCQDISAFNLTQGCYTDKANNMNWLVIPHFSGLGPQITAAGVLGSISSDDTVYQCYGATCSARINVTVTNANLGNRKQNITINNTDDRGALDYNIEYYNNTDGAWYDAGDTNSTNIDEFNLTVGINRFRINITLLATVSTKWNFSIQVNSTYYDSAISVDAIRLSSPVNGTNYGIMNNYTFTLYSSNWTTQACSLYINNVLSGSNSTVLNGTATTIAGTYATSGNIPWYISCNTTGNSTVNYTMIDGTAPAIFSNNTNATAGITGDSFYVYTNWTESSVSSDNMTCRLYANGLLYQQTNSTGTWCNFTFVSNTTYFPNATLVVNATDLYGNTGRSSSMFMQLAFANAILANTSTAIDFNATSNSNMTIYLASNVTARINVTGITASSVPTGNLTVKAIEILADNVTKGNLTWAYIRIFYTGAEVTAAGVNESSIKVYYYNDSLSAWQVESSTGVDQDNNFAWANISHFSLFGVFGTAPATTATTPASSSDTSTPGGTVKGEYRITRANANEENVVDVSDDATGITKIMFYVHSAAWYVKFKVEELASLASGTPEPEGTVYKLMSISLSNMDSSNLKSAKIRFEVAKSWLASNNIEAGSVALQRYANGNWGVLDTVKQSESDSNIFYDASTPGFSTFVITGVKADEGEATEVTEEKEQEGTLPAEGEQPTGEGMTSKIGKWLFTILIALALLLALALMMRKKGRLMFWMEPTEGERMKSIRKSVMNRVKRQSRGG